MLYSVSPHSVGYCVSLHNTLGIVMDVFQVVIAYPEPNEALSYCCLLCP